MATPRSKPAQPQDAPKLSGPAFARPALARSGEITLSRSSPAWTYWGNPMVLKCMGGQIVPDLAMAKHTPGLNGNGKRPGRGEGWGRAMAEQGYIEIPHDIECVAFGEPRRGELSNYVDRYEDGQHILHVEAWRRPRVIGKTTLWTAAGCFDSAGWLDFHVRCMTLISPDGLDEAQIEVALRPLIRDITDSLRRSDDRAKHRLTKLLPHVPVQYAPADIRRLVEALPPAE